MSREKYLTVAQLISELSKYDGDLIPIITREGNGHQTPILLRDIKIEDSAYFPDFNITFDEDQSFLNIGNI